MADVYDSLTGQEYLTFIGELYGLDYDLADYKAKSLMDLFGVGEVYHARIASYSKGMRQKLLIISSLLHNPELLFFELNPSMALMPIVCDDFSAYDGSAR